MVNIQKEVLVQRVWNYPCLSQVIKKHNKDLLMKENNILFLIRNLVRTVGLNVS